MVFEKGYKVSDETKEKMRQAKLGKMRPPRSEEWIKKIADSNRGRRNTKETKEKISKALIGRPVSEETRAKMSTAKKGRPKPKEWIERYRVGANSPVWNGGSSFEPYCPKFNREFKERVRDFFGRKCVECGKHEGSKKLSVHHVNFNKMSCCDGTKPIFVTLCLSCHMKTNYNRVYWEKHFTDIINTQYNGQCYTSR